MVSKRDELAKLLSVIDENMVVRLDEKAGALFIGGERADAARLANLKAEAEFFAESDLWKIINNTVRELAQKAMFVDGKGLEDLQKGRSMLYLLSSQNKIVNTFRGFIHKPTLMPPRQG